jgi:hypothetical protein
MQVIHGSNGGLIKAWIDGVTVEEQARQQLDNMASMPFIHKHIAIMPDCHWGMGATIGSVIPTKGAIIPAAVGVDLGCGMMAHRTSLVASDLPDNLFGLRTAIEERIPHGRTDNAILATALLPNSASIMMPCKTLLANIQKLRRPPNALIGMSERLGLETTLLKCALTKISTFGLCFIQVLAALATASAAISLKWLSKICADGLSICQIRTWLISHKAPLCSGTIWVR